MEKIGFCPDGGEKVEFYVLEQTRLGGCDYILVTDSMDSEEEEGEALILKDISAPEDKEAIYEIVEDERELMRWPRFFPICWRISTWKNNPGKLAVRKCYVG